MIYEGNQLGLALWCWLGTLEFAPLKVSGSIISGTNFGGLVSLLKKNDLWRKKPVPLMK